jgi:DNA-binding response OmpR family regulator
MKRILVVEDEEEIRKTIAEILENSGYEVRLAFDGQQALDYLETEIPDLVLSDIMMPNINGYHVLKCIRNKFVTEPIPFIFLTAKTDYADLRVGMNCGAEDYLFKPFRVKELIDAIEAQFNKKEVKR